MAASEMTLEQKVMALEARIWACKFDQAQLRSAAVRYEQVGMRKSAKSNRVGAEHLDQAIAAYTVQLEAIKDQIRAGFIARPVIGRHAGQPKE